MKILDRIARMMGYEKRAHPSNPPEWLRKLLGGGAGTFTGIDVTRENAMESGAFLCGTSHIADDIAGLPWKVYRKLADGTRTRVLDHPLSEILHDQPNPWMTSFTWRETMMHHALTESNAYSRIYRGDTGKLVAIIPIEPDHVEPEFSTDLDELGIPRLTYRIRPPGAPIEIVDARDMLHIRALSWNGIEGRSRVKLAKEALALSLALERYGGGFFRNGGVPPIALEFPEELTDEAFARIAAMWAARYGGLETAGRPAFLEAGAKAHVLGVDPEKAQATESRKLSVTDIARVLKIPPHMVGDLEHATFSNIEHQSIQYVTYTIGPWTIRIEQETNVKAFTMDERRAGFFAELDLSGLLRGDLKTRYEAYKMAREGGWFSRNDIRRRENENAIPGGDDYLTPLNFTTLGAEPEEVSGDGEARLRVAR